MTTNSNDGEGRRDILTTMSTTMRTYWTRLTVRDDDVDTNEKEMRGKTLSELWTLHKYNWTEFPLPPPEETTLQTVEKVLLSAFRCGFCVFDILFDVLLGFQF